jgi:hypothetical protein
MVVVVVVRPCVRSCGYADNEGKRIVRSSGRAVASLRRSSGGEMRAVEAADGSSGRACALWDRARVKKASVSMVSADTGFNGGGGERCGDYVQSSNWSRRKFEAAR